jgi:hypothetical protein
LKSLPLAIGFPVPASGTSFAFLASSPLKSFVASNLSFVASSGAFDESAGAFAAWKGFDLSMSASPSPFSAKSLFVFDAASECEVVQQYRCTS